MSLILILSSIVALTNYIIFSIAILKKRVRPHRITRFIMLLITLISTLSLFAQHNTTAIYLTGSYFIGCVLIFLLSLKYGMGGWSKTDILCLLLALVGIGFWISTDNPIFALYISILADIVGWIPTIIKAYRYPHTEFWLINTMDFLAATLNIFSNKTFSFNAIAFPLYIIFINTIILSVVYRKDLKRILKF